jgi:L-fucose isomerase
MFLATRRRVGILTFSDGREFAHLRQLEATKDFEQRLVDALESTGEVECVRSAIVWSTELAQSEARRIACSGVDVTVFNYPVWAFPNFSAIAARFAPGPFILFSNMDPQYSGMVALLAAAGALEGLGDTTFRVMGDVSEDRVLTRLMTYVRAVSAKNRLRGQVYGLFGGRSMGMYTATPDPSLWQKQLGIDIEHIDQWEIVRRCSEVDASRASQGRQWLESLCREVRYDGRVLTPKKLELQIRSYHAVRSIIEEYNLDFIGIKGQPELTNSFCTMDVAEAFLNDPYDWEGEHEPIVCATEADSDGALTMQIFKHLANTPVLFADVRYYHPEGDFWDLSNSGQHATYFAARSMDPARNLSRVRLLPEVFFFPAGGASVQHVAAPGLATLARLMRRDGCYWMAIASVEVLDPGDAQAERLGAMTTGEWPHAFVRFKVTADELVETFSANHIHGVYGDYVAELVAVCKACQFGYRVYA